MENNLVILNESKKNNLEFDLEIEGLDPTNIKVAYVLETKDYNMAFECSQKKNNTWSVTIPPLSHIKKDTYKYHISVIAEGYYFEPLTGVANVEGSHQIYATKPQPISSKIEQEKTQQPPLEEKKAATPKTEKVEERKTTPKKTTPVVETKPTLPSDDVVQKIIDEARKRKAQPQPKADEAKEQKAKEVVSEKKQSDEKKTSLPSDDAIQKIIEEVKRKSPEKDTKPLQTKAPVFRKKEEKKVEPVFEKKEEKVEPPKKNEKDEKIRQLLEASKTEKKTETPEKKVAFKKGSVIVH